MSLVNGKNEQRSPTTQVDKRNLKSKMGKYIPGQFFFPREKKRKKNLALNNTVINRHRKF